MPLVGGYLVWIAIYQARLVPPTPETESVFLRTYTPNPVLDRFKADNVAQLSSGSGDGAEIGFATHDREFKPIVVIHTADWVALMQALRDDIVSRLATQGAEIVEQSGSAVDGYTMRYTVGKSQGTIMMGPLKNKPDFLLANTGPGSDHIAVSLRILIHEKWIKAENRGHARG